MNDYQNKVIQGLWVGGELSLMEQLSIQSFLKNGHEYHLYTYEDIKNIPPGTTVKDGNEILPADEIFTIKSGWGIGSYSGFADLFRVHLLKERGGWWVDTDIICLKHFDFESDYVISSSHEGEWGDLANNCVLKLPPDSSLANYLVQVCHQKKLEDTGFGELGPGLIQKAIAELGYEKHIVSHGAFCPITWRAVKRIVYPKQKLTPEKVVEDIKNQIRPFLRHHQRPGRITQNSYALHLWNEVWRQNSLDKNAQYDKKCLYERLKGKYL